MSTDGIAAPAAEVGLDTADEPTGAGRDLDRFAPWVFGAFVAVAAPLILFHYGSYHWFMRDDFVFLADRTGRYPDLISAYGGAHWVAIPRVIYWVLWQLFGMTTYLPYQATVVALHLTAAVLLRLVPDLAEELEVAESGTDID